MKASGFTLVELVMTLVLVGILAAVAMPRLMNRSDFDARGFADQTISMLRYAQKYAVAQRRPVFVRLNGASVALCQDATCATPVRAPEGANSGRANAACNNDSTWYCEALPGGVALSSSLALFYFSGEGKPYLQSDVPPASSFSSVAITISSAGTTRNLSVEAETGYVR